MITKVRVVSLGLLLSLAVSGQETANPDTASALAIAPRPRLQFSGTDFNFGNRWAGEAIKHDFIFTNSGTQTLEITGVRPSCGCTTASNWLRQIEPGQTGIIPVQFNSGNFNGPVTKTVTVTCNDPDQRMVILKIQGTIKRAIELTPDQLSFVLSSEAITNAVRSVRIRNNTETPLTLSEPVCTNRAFKVALKTLEPDKEFELTVSTQPPLPEGVTQGRVTMKSSATNYPAVVINLVALVQPVLRASPAVLYLPAGPLSAAMQRSITIRNNGTNPVTFFDPQVNAEGVDVQTSDALPGQAGAFTLTFPSGFRAPEGRALEFTVKTSLLRTSILQVPIRLNQLSGSLAIQPASVATNLALRPKAVSAMSSRGFLPDAIPQPALPAASSSSPEHPITARTAKPDRAAPPMPPMPPMPR